MILILAIDSPESGNRITIDRSGNPVVDYRFSSQTIRSLVQALRASARIFFAAGAIRSHLAATENFFVKNPETDQIDTLIREEHFKTGKVTISAAHLMGGCRMGTNPETSVTDSRGKIHGQPDLYVADGSLFPAASEVNPYLTIMALADRVAEGIRRDLGEA